MSQVITYSKSIRSLHYQIEEASNGAKETHSYRVPVELKGFGDILKSNDSLKRIFRTVMDSLSSFSSKNAVFYAEKLLTLMDKNTIAVYLLGNRMSTR